MKSNYVSSVVFYGLNETPKKIIELTLGAEVPAYNIVWQSELLKLTIEGL